MMDMGCKIKRKYELQAKSGKLRLRSEIKSLNKICGTHILNKK